MWRCLTSHSACHVFMYTRTLTWTGLVNHQQHTHHITHCLMAPLTLHRACLMYAMVHSMWQLHTHDHGTPNSTVQHMFSCPGTVGVGRIAVWSAAPLCHTVCSTRQQRMLQLLHSAH